MTRVFYPIFRNNASVLLIITGKAFNIIRFRVSLGLKVNVIYRI